MSKPTREQLIVLCEAGVVPQEKWTNRDTAGAQRQLGECLALLRAGCDFEIDNGMDDYGGRTLWVRVTFKGFDWFEEHLMSGELFYVPTSKRLAERAGKDWY